MYYRKVNCRYNVTQKGRVKYQLVLKETSVFVLQEGLHTENLILNRTFWSIELKTERRNTADENQPLIKYIRSTLDLLFLCRNSIAGGAAI